MLLLILMMNRDAPRDREVVNSAKKDGQPQEGPHFCHHRIVDRRQLIPAVYQHLSNNNPRCRGGNLLMRDNRDNSSTLCTNCLRLCCSDNRCRCRLPKQNTNPRYLD